MPIRLNLCYFYRTEQNYVTILDFFFRNSFDSDLRLCHLRSSLINLKVAQSSSNDPTLQTSLTPQSSTAGENHRVIAIDTYHDFQRIYTHKTDNALLRPGREVLRNTKFKPRIRVATIITRIYICFSINDMPEFDC